jgi:hypothetical protein
MNGTSLDFASNGDIYSWDGNQVVIRNRDTGATTSLQPADHRGGEGFAVANTSSLTIPTPTAPVRTTNGIGYAVSQNSIVPRSLTFDELVSIFRCEVPEIVPVLPLAGSATRDAWLTHLFGSAVFPPAGATTSCYLGGGTNQAVLPPENDGRQLTPTQVMPYSVTAWVSQVTAVAQDIHGRSVLGLYDTSAGGSDGDVLTPGTAPTSPIAFNAAGRFAGGSAGVSFAVKQNSSIPKSLTQDELVAIFRCEAPWISPVLPKTGSDVRDVWLTYLFGSTALPIGVGATSCYLGGGTDNTVLPDANDGRSRTSSQIMPYSATSWIAQTSALIPDLRGKTVMGLLDTSPSAMDGNLATAGTAPTSPIIANLVGPFAEIA